MKTCSAEGCGRTGKLVKGFCTMHYQRWKKHGDPLTVLDNRFKPGNRAGGGLATRFKRGQHEGDRHPMWRGGTVGTVGAHRRVKRARGPASAYMCIAGCGREGAHWAYTHDAPDERVDPRDGPYSPTPVYYQPMCVPCHKVFDLARATR